MRRLMTIIILVIALLVAAAPAWAHHKADHYPPGCQPGFSEGRSSEAPGCQKHQPTSFTRLPEAGAANEPGITVGMLTIGGLGVFAAYYLIRRRRFQALRI